MNKKSNSVKVRIGIPDDEWDELIKITGETDPNRVADRALRMYLALIRGEKEPTDA